jgi:hypothetical protein
MKHKKTILIVLSLMLPVSALLIGFISPKNEFMLKHSDDINLLVIVFISAIILHRVFQKKSNKNN